MNDITWINLLQAFVLGIQWACAVVYYPEVTTWKERRMTVQLVCLITLFALAGLSHIMRN